MYGASALASSGVRAVEVELAKLEWKFSLTTLWGIQKYFDSMVIPRLIVEAKALQFPASELALTLTVHAAPRRLKMGKSLGRIVSLMARSILAGCKRSTDLARLYLLQPIRKVYEHSTQVSTHQHVDDISSIAVFATSDWLHRSALRSAIQLHRGLQDLQHEVSSKSLIIPVSGTARRLVTDLQFA